MIAMIRAGAHKVSVVDHCSEAGAAELASRLTEFWRERGIHVKVWTERLTTARSDNHAPMYSVRSDIKLGQVRWNLSPKGRWSLR